MKAMICSTPAAHFRVWSRTAALGPGPERAGACQGIESRIGDLSDYGNPDDWREAGGGMLPGKLGCSLSSQPQTQKSSPASAGCPGQRPDDPYTLEAATHTLSDILRDAAVAYGKALTDLTVPLQQLAKVLGNRLAEEAEDLEGPARTRLEAARHGLIRRIDSMLLPWRAMLRDLEAGTMDGFVDWFSVERSGQREFDVGLHRHWIDPTKPFADVVLAPSHGVVVTSATLRDETGDGVDEEGWRHAEVRTGFNHLVLPGKRSSHVSPFDYAAQARVFIVNDLKKNEMEQVAGAYRALFEASGGGALGLFTAISRLKQVYRHLAPSLANAGLPLLAQHVDAFDPGTLIDIFRAEDHSCLLGTDAIRDGVDVPGAALRLIVFDRVPWPRPSVLHRARRDAFGARKYDEMLVRLRLKQAFGRLIRRQDDHGVFVMLDGATPSRLLTAFPPGVPVDRIGLKEAIEKTGAFLSDRVVSG
ncbi:MAG: helicase C-terminal domain-containing protein [Alphaproteobacteria bacterium]